MKTKLKRLEKIGSFYFKLRSSNLYLLHTNYFDQMCGVTVLAIK